MIATDGDQSQDRGLWKATVEKAHLFERIVAVCVVSNNEVWRRGKQRDVSPVAGDQMQGWL
ncbi:MAG: hypothetical protein WAU00_06635 [Caldilinea sp.]|nr:hypothetical protein [Anaerolineales bacterium]HRA66925.1 hypothetical protein [Caldilinea sp.]